MTTRLLRITGDHPRYRKGHELEELAPREPIRPGAVDAQRFQALLDSGAAEEVKEIPPDERWELSTPPDEYLERWPDGPRAELAREILGEGD